MFARIIHCCSLRPQAAHIALKAYEVPEAGSRNSRGTAHGQRIATRCGRIRYDYD